jgi:choline kinase
MEYKLKKIYLSLLLLLSLPVDAVVTESGVITHFIIEGNIVSIWLSGSDKTNECSGGSRWTLVKTDSLFEEKFSTVLAAAASKNNITIRSTGTCGTWNSNRIYYIKF